MDSRRLLINLLVLACASYGSGQYYDNYNKNYSAQSAPLIYTPPPVVDQSLQCARLWDAFEYQGRILDLGYNQKRIDLSAFYFTPQAVKVKPGCALTIFDEIGTKQILDRDTSWLGVSYFIFIF